MTTPQVRLPKVGAVDHSAPTVQLLNRRPADILRRPWESTAIFCFFAALYIGFGEWLVADKHVVGFVTLDHFNRALMIWHNSPPKLSAVGFDFPPLTTLLIAPLTIITSLARTLYVVPVASAVFAAGTMVCLNSLMRRAVVPLPMRVLVLLALGGNPLLALYASGGASDFMPLFFVIAGLGALAAWYVTADIRLVLVAGLAFALASLAGYSTLLLFLVAAVGVAGILARNRAREDEIEGTTVGFTAPTLYAVALWVAFSTIIDHRPFAWVPHQHGTESFGFSDLVRDTGRLVLDAAPIAIVVLPALVIVGIVRRDGFTIWCAGFLGATILMPGLAAAMHLTTSPMAMRDGLPILLVAIVGAVWLARTLPLQQSFVAAVLVVALAISIPFTFTQMKTFPHQNLESVFTTALSTGKSQDGAHNQSGQVVGIGNEEDMAGWIRQHVRAHDAILTDNAQTYAVMLLSGLPAVFFDRVDKSDGPWMKVARKPGGAVQYMLLTRGNPNDLLAQLYPSAAKGADAQLPVVHANGRYVLVSVAPNYVRPTITPGATP